MHLAKQCTACGQVFFCESCCALAHQTPSSGHTGIPPHGLVCQILERMSRLPFSERRVRSDLRLLIQVYARCLGSASTCAADLMAFRALHFHAEVLDAHGETHVEEAYRFLIGAVRDFGLPWDICLEDVKADLCRL